jgi:hypothetical protein
VNTGALWPSLEEAERRVLGTQTKLHRWAGEDPTRQFDDLYNLVYDPAFLLVAWRRIRGNTGARTAGVDRERGRVPLRQGAGSRPFCMSYGASPRPAAFGLNRSASGSSQKAMDAIAGSGFRPWPTAWRRRP